MVLGGGFYLDSILENIFFGGGGVEDDVDTFFDECDVISITSADGFDKMYFWGTLSHFGAIFILCLLLRYCQVFRSLTEILKKQEMSGEIKKKAGIPAFAGRVASLFGAGDVVVGGTIQKP